MSSSSSSSHRVSSNRFPFGDALWLVTRPEYCFSLFHLQVRSGFILTDDATWTLFNSPHIPSSIATAHLIVPWASGDGARRKLPREIGLLQIVDCAVPYCYQLKNRLLQPPQSASHLPQPTLQQSLVNSHMKRAYIVVSNRGVGMINWTY